MKLLDKLPNNIRKATIRDFYNGKYNVGLTFYLQGDGHVEEYIIDDLWNDRFIPELSGRDKKGNYTDKFIIKGCGLRKFTLVKQFINKGLCYVKN